MEFTVYLGGGKVDVRAYFKVFAQVEGILSRQSVFVQTRVGQQTFGVLLGQRYPSRVPITSFGEVQVGVGTYTRVVIVTDVVGLGAKYEQAESSAAIAMAEWTKRASISHFL